MPTLTIFLTILYTIVLWVWLKKVKRTIPALPTRILMWIHAGFATLFFISVLLALEGDMYFRGFWTTKIIVWGFLITGIFTFTIGYKACFNIATRLYFFCFTLLPIFIGLFLFLPFIGVILVFAFFLSISGTAETVYFEDKTFRAQTNHTSVMAGPALEVYKKHGFFEHRVYDGGPDFWPHIDSVKVHQLNGSASVQAYHDGEGDISNPFVIEVKD